MYIAYVLILTYGAFCFNPKENTMINDPKKIEQLTEKLDQLLKKQEIFLDEINRLSFEISQLKVAQEEEIPPVAETEMIPEPVYEKPEEPVHVVIQPEKTQWQEIKKEPVVRKKEEKSDLEKFIGENLINKIGILITVIGVAIGAKYAIDHQMLSPLTRIILGYLSGVILLGFAIKLKNKYKNYSAVLLSGAMAIFYFITYIAYDFYNLFPQSFTFGLMVVFTIFTVISALHYNQQVIAHIGLVGAYGVPFLLSDGSGRVVILFSYMAIINIGILAISVKKYWKSLYYAAFGLSWLIFLSWYFSKYETSVYFSQALTFLIIFYLIFYLTFLVYKLARKEIFEFDDVLLLLANSFIFFGIGYSMLDKHITGEQYLGLFTLCNAIIHFIVAVIIYKNKLADKDLFYLVAGLVLVFITIAIPVQMDGSWVTLLWTGEAALLFVIGRTQKVRTYEKLSYPLMILAVISLIQDWTKFYGSYNPESQVTKITPFLNICFFSSVLFILAFALIVYIQNKNKENKVFKENQLLETLSQYLAPVIMLGILYFMFRVEISNYFKQLYIDSGIAVTDNSDPEYPNIINNFDEDLNKFRILWIINYTMVFLIALSAVNIYIIKNKFFGHIILWGNLTCTAVFLLQGLYVISELRESYINQTLAQYYHRGIFHVAIRYISILIAAGLMIISYLKSQKDFMELALKKWFDLFLYIFILWIVSSELIHWLDMSGATDLYKLGLSILWGIYSLLLISVGIWKNKKYLRIAAICLFGVTLLKLFFYDISHLSTISKTIVFVSLGILLLIISFLYNKYKHIIGDESNE